MAPPSARAPFGAGRELLVVFALTVLAPGLVLGAFGVRAFLQERRFISQQIRERVDRAADFAAADVERELRDWAADAARLDGGDVPDLSAARTSLRGALSEPGAAAIVFHRGGMPGIWPDRQVLYRPPALGTSPVTSALPDDVAEVERIEVRDKEYARAAAGYERLLARAASHDRAEVLHRLARTYRKAGRESDAVRIYGLMTSATERVGAVPADLIARFETRAPDLYRDLVMGRWLIDRSRYTFYAASARSFAADSPEAVERLAAIERRKGRLTEAVDAVVAGATPSGYVSWPRRAPGGEARAQIVAEIEWLSAHLWPAALARATAAGFRVSIVADSGDTIFQSDPVDASVAQAGSTRSLDEGVMPWRIHVSPRDPRTLGADLQRRQSIYLVMLLLVTALLGCGTYLTLRVVRKELEVARLKADFVSTVSHEFRSPLTGIRQLAELLLDGRVPSEARRREYYERITRESDRLSRLVENLLDFSRMEEGRKSYRFEPTDPATWLRGVVADAESQYASRGVAIHASIPAALPAIAADREALASAVHNLLDNAVKYSPGRPAVWLEADAVNSDVAIRVRDEGVGIDESDKRHMFEKFYRGRANITREVKGAGLGLSLVQHIVAAHGGTVECVSRPGEGSTFSIHLPCRASS